MLDAALRAAGEQWWVITDDQGVTAFGAASNERAPHEVHAADLLQITHPESASVAARLIEALRSNQTTEPQTARIQLAYETDQWQWYDLCLIDRRGDPDIAGIICRIIPARQSDGHAPPNTPWSTHDDAGGDTTVSDDALASLAEVVPAAILTANIAGRVVYTNRELRRLLHVPVHELTGNGWRNVVYPDDVDSVANASVAALHGERSELHFRINDNHDIRWLHGRFAPMRVSGEVAGIVAVFDDVTTQREHEADLAHRATHDPLTGLPNRLLLRDRLSQALGRQSRNGTPVAATFIDLDNFKEVNDVAGHSAGDEFLMEIARRLLYSSRPTDTVARLGGDEFVVIGEDLDPTNATSQAERLLESITEPIEVGGRTITPSASIGVAVSTSPATVDEMLHQADAAMYRAKRTGSGQIEVFAIA